MRTAHPWLALAIRSSRDAWGAEHPGEGVAKQLDAARRVSRISCFPVGRGRGSLASREAGGESDRSYAGWLGGDVAISGPQVVLGGVEGARATLPLGGRAGFGAAEPAPDSFWCLPRRSARGRRTRARPVGGLGGGGRWPFWSLARGRAAIGVFAGGKQSLMRSKNVRICPADTFRRCRKTCPCTRCPQGLAHLGGMPVASAPIPRRRRRDRGSACD